MTALNPVNNNSFNCLTNAKDYIQQLFQAAESGEWEKVYPEIVKNPALLNFPLQDGKTILWVAANQVSEHKTCHENGISTKALEFIENAKNQGWELNVDAYPLTNQGESVLWLLLNAVPDLIVPLRNFPLENIILHILTQYVKCNVNISPLHGPSQGITAAMLALKKYGDIPKAALLFPVISYSRGIDGTSTFGCLATHLAFSNKNIAKEHILKIIEQDPKCDIETQILQDTSLLELVLCDPSFHEQKKLVCYLILCGSKARAGEFRWRKTLDEIKKELTTVFDKAKREVNSYLREVFQNQLMRELKLNIILDFIRVSIPELKDFPESILIKQLMNKSGFD